jgi:hypothetical protein
MKGIDSRYVYWQEIISAIEIYTLNKVIKDEKYFYYDSLDFTYALEKFLYFGIYGENSIYNLLQNDNISENYIDVKDVMHQDVLSFIFSQKGIKINVKFNFKNFFLRKYIFKNNFFINGSLRAFNHKFNNLEKVEHVFVIIHHNLIRYFLPIYKKLKNSAFLLCGDYEKSKNLCNEEGCQYIELKRNIQKKYKQANVEIMPLVIQYETVKYCVDTLLPKTIIVPEGTAPIDELFNLASKKHKHMRTVCIQNGWSPVQHNGIRNMHYDLFLSWGDVFSKLLKPYNKEQRFLSVGNHVSKINKININKDTISFFDQGDVGLISKDNSSNFLKFAIYLSKKYSDLKIVIRRHPSSQIVDKLLEIQIQECQTIEFMDVDKFTLSEVLLRTKVAVSMFSSVLYEAMLYDAIPFSFNETELPKLKPSLADLTMGVEVKTIEKAKAEMDKLICEQRCCNSILNNIKKYRADYFKDFGEFACNNIIKEIERS